MGKEAKSKRVSDILNTDEYVLTSALLEYAVDLAKKADASGILVYADAFGNIEATGELVTKNPQIKFIVVSQDAKTTKGAEQLVDHVIEVPPVRLTRIGQIKLALLTGLSKGVLKRGDTVICLAGISQTGQLDSMFVTHVGEEFEILGPTAKDTLNPPGGSDVFNRVLEIAISLGHEGREGKPVGTTFVIGHMKELKPYWRQMVLNPFHGYPREQRSIFHDEVRETVKEYSSIDGAFIISQDGTVEAAGAYLQPTNTPDELPRGLGSRHHSAAGITATTRATSITVSESTGTVTVYQNGRIFIELEPPRRIGLPTKRSDEFFEQEPSS